MSEGRRFHPRQSCHSAVGVPSYSLIKLAQHSAIFHDIFCHLCDHAKMHVVKCCSQAIYKWHFCSSQCGSSFNYFQFLTLYDISLCHNCSSSKIDTFLLRSSSWHSASFSLLCVDLCLSATFNGHCLAPIQCHQHMLYSSKSPVFTQSKQWLKHRSGHA